MARSPINNDKLQQFFDDELSDVEAAKIELALQTDSIAREELRAMRELGDSLRLDLAAQTKDIDSNALFASIVRRIDETEFAPVPVRNNVHSFHDAHAKRMRPWVNGAVASIIAAAAAAMMFFSNSVRAPENHASVAQFGTNAPTEIAMAVPSGSHVVDVDFGNNAGTVFEVEGSVGQPLAVVWIDEAHVDREYKR